MDRRRKIIIAGATFIIVLLIIFIVLWFLNRPQTTVVPAGENVNNGMLVPEDVPETIKDLPDGLIEQPALETDLRSIALIFAERFGSYSNQGNFSNLNELESLMTVKMKAYADILKSKSAASDIYYGITTKALTVKIESFEEAAGRSEITVTTQRQESKGTTLNPEIFYQDLKLQLVKTESGWKVDSATWQEIR